MADLGGSEGSQHDPRVISRVFAERLGSKCALMTQNPASNIRGLSGREASPGEDLVLVLVVLVVVFYIGSRWKATTETIKKKATTRATETTAKTSPGLAPLSRPPDVGS